jgi:hypothetical protein
MPAAYQTLESFFIIFLSLHAMHRDNSCTVSNLTTIVLTSADVQAIGHLFIPVQDVAEIAKPLPRSQ